MTETKNPTDQNQQFILLKLPRQPDNLKNFKILILPCSNQNNQQDDSTIHCFQV